MKASLILFLIITVALAASTCFVIVDETELAVITTFGNPTKSITKPGLVLKLPFPIQRTYVLDARLLILTLKPIELLTLDKKNVMVDAFLLWKIADPVKFIESIGDRVKAEQRLTDIIYSELGATLGKYDFAALISTESESIKIEEMLGEVRQYCKKAVESEYGITIMDVHLKRINFPEQNRASVFNRMRAERERIATRYRSEGEEEATKIKAKADRERRELIALAQEKADRLIGEGQAEATTIYAEAYSQDADLFRFLETLTTYEKALKEKATIVVPGDSPLSKLLFMGPELPQHE